MGTAPGREAEEAVLWFCGESDRRLLRFAPTDRPPDAPIGERHDLISASGADMAIAAAPGREAEEVVPISERHDLISASGADMAIGAAPGREAEEAAHLFL